MNFKKYINYILYNSTINMQKIMNIYIKFNKIIFNNQYSNQK